MRLVDVRDGVLEIRWTWLPYWLAINPKLKTELEVELRDRAILNGLTSAEEDLDLMHAWVCTRLQGLFPAFGGLDLYLDSLRAVHDRPEPRKLNS